MKRRELLKKLGAAGAVFVREGGSHTIYLNPETGVLIVVPRHPEIAEGTARKILKEASARKV